MRGVFGLLLILLGVGAGGYLLLNGGVHLPTPGSSAGITDTGQSSSTGSNAGGELRNGVPSDTPNGRTSGGLAS